MNPSLQLHPDPGIAVVVLYSDARRGVETVRVLTYHCLN